MIEKNIQPINSKGIYATSSAQRKAYDKYHSKHETLVAYLPVGVKKEICEYGYNPNRLLIELLFQHLQQLENGEQYER